MRWLVLAGFAALLLAGAPALAGDKPLHGVALVIGESRYEQLPQLTNPAKDARDIDRLLGDLGFEVDRVLNANGQELQEAIARFEDEAKDADVAMIYYSGHGIEAKGENFIAPTDTDLASPQTAGDSMIAVQPIVDALAKVAPVSIVLLDACRSDPFPPGQTIVLPGDTAPTPVEGQGLAAVRGPMPVTKANADPSSLGTVIGFSASPGEPALDGAPGENSPYAAALLKHFAAGGYSFGDVMTMVTEEVYLKTRAKQLPWVNSSLRRVLTFEAPAEDEGDSDQQAIKTERRKLLLSIAATPPATQKYVESLAGQEQVPLDSLYGMLDALGIKASDDNGDLQKQMAQGAERLKELLAQKPAAVKADPELERLSKLADEAEAEGAIALALKYRDEASSRADTLLKGKQAEAEQLRQDMLDIADTYAANAATALLNFEQVQAAGLFAKAFDAAKDWDRAKAVGFKISQGDALTDHGYYTSDNDALTEALAVYQEALGLAPKDSDPKDWGKLENRIGQAQALLGALRADTALLEAAVTSFQQALTVQTRADLPTDWASAQNNLGNALYALGQRKSDQAMLQQAIDAFDAATTVDTREADPGQWAIIVSNRASAQMALADAIYAATEDVQVRALTAGEDAEHLPEVTAAANKAVAILSEAIGALQSAMTVKSRDSDPLDWAQVQHTLATALGDRGKLSASADDQRAAADAYRALLTVYDKTHTPTLWTRTAGNLAATLRQYAANSKDFSSLGEAVDLLQQCLALTPRATSPAEWANLEMRLGNVYSDLATNDNSLENGDRAVEAYRASLQVNTIEQDFGEWTHLQFYTFNVLLRIGVAHEDVPRLTDARDTAQAAVEVFQQRGDATDAESFEKALPLLDQAIALFAQESNPPSATQ